MQQPPPRKGNYVKFLKNLHSEQLAKLQLKNQHECDLLEDIRTFTMKRSALEKSYSEALLKISTAYLNKKLPNIPDIKYEGSEEKWNMWNVWRTVLEENEKLARARLAAVEVFQQQIADESKTLKTQKLQNSRKIIDNLANIQKELHLCVQELDKSKKLYFDEEHSAKDVRDKAKDIEEKLKKKKGSFFQSITSLQKTGAKVTSKKEQLEVKSSGARNDYLLSLAATNAHQNHYFLVDVQTSLMALEMDVFDKVSEFLTLMGRTELLTCSAAQHSFGKIRDQAQQLTREYNLQCCYLYYPVLKQHIQYEFEPCDNDPIRKIVADLDETSEILNGEAKKWAKKIANENNCIRECQRKIQLCLQQKESGDQHKIDSNDPNEPIDTDTNIDQLREKIRKAETNKLKAVARIEMLRNGGINVDEWIQEAEMYALQDMQRSTSTPSLQTEDQPSSDSFYDSDFGDGDGGAGPSGRHAAGAGAGGMKTGQNSALEKAVICGDSDDDEVRRVDSDDDGGGSDDDAMTSGSGSRSRRHEEQQQQQQQQQIDDFSSGWDDCNFDANWATAETVVQTPSIETKAGTSSAVAESVDPDAASDVLYKCTAVFSYNAENPDELSMVENEQLDIISEGDGDGWLRARNYRGEEGYVPFNYLDKETSETSTTQGISGQISFSSVDYTVDQEDEGFPTDQDGQMSQPPPSQPPPALSSTKIANDDDDNGDGGGDEDDDNGDQTRSPDLSMADHMLNERQSSIIRKDDDEDNGYGNDGIGEQYCFALYDYDASGEDELAFEEGLIIRILNRNANGIDDGWWEGELEGKRGKFPSMLVEECDENGEPLVAGDCDGNEEDGDGNMEGSGAAITDDNDNNKESVNRTKAPMTFDNEDSGNNSDENTIARKSKPPPGHAPPPIPAEYRSTSMESYISDALDEAAAAAAAAILQNPTAATAATAATLKTDTKETKNKMNLKAQSLGVAQIIVTAATPMTDEARHDFPRSEATTSEIEEAETVPEEPVAEDGKDEGEDNGATTINSSGESSPSGEVLTAKQISVEKDSPPADAKFDADFDEIEDDDDDADDKTTATTNGGPVPMDTDDYDDFK